MSRFKSAMSIWVTRFRMWSRKSSLYKSQAQRIEDYREGYPRFCALIAADSAFFICRRFLNLRARLLLLKQDRLSLLEKEIERVDNEETANLFVRSSRHDKNAERSAVLSEINDALTDYGNHTYLRPSSNKEFGLSDAISDDFLRRNCRVLGYESANERDLVSLQNWLRGNACMTREETAYLANFNDLMSLTSAKDPAVAQLGIWVEDCLIRFYKSFRQHLGHKFSSDPHVYVHSGSLIRRLCHMLVLTFTTSFLLVPAAICNSTSSATSRLIVISIAIVCFLATLSGLIKARAIEVLLAGATYATVLIVFVSGGGSIT